MRVSSGDLRSTRQTWFDAQLDLDPDRLIVIDETGASTKMARLRSRSRRGTRCRAAGLAFRRSLEDHYPDRRAGPQRQR